MAVLPRPVTMMLWSQPEAMASSTPYWMIGLSTRGSISFGCALVAGRNRVPQPAAGKTALRTRMSPLASTGGRCRGYHPVLGRQRDERFPGPRAGVAARPVGSPMASGPEVLLEGTDEVGEGLRPVERRQMRGPAQDPMGDVRDAPEERAGADPEDEVEVAVDGQDRA